MIEIEKKKKKTIKNITDANRKSGKVLVSQGKSQTLCNGNGVNGNSDIIYTNHFLYYNKSTVI